MKYLSCSSPRSRLGGVKARHKRQVLQDMARPLKHWLYKHRDNPYPTKTEKVLLALGSHMTLVQVRPSRQRTAYFFLLGLVILIDPSDVCARFPTGLQTPGEG